MPRLTDALRNPFATLTSIVPPPPPGTRAFRAWNQMTKANVALYRWTGGKVGGSLDGNPVLLLHHVGRRTGEPRVTPLLYLRDGDDLVVVASMGGVPKNPAWYVNLVAAPRTRAQVGREVRQVRARTASAQERVRLWPLLVANYPAFSVYQERTDREIPVVVLAPDDGA